MFTGISGKNFNSKSICGRPGCGTAIFFNKSLSIFVVLFKVKHKGISGVKITTESNVHTFYLLFTCHVIPSAIILIKNMWLC